MKNKNRTADVVIAMLVSLNSMHVVHVVVFLTLYFL